MDGTGAAACGTCEYPTPLPACYQLDATKLTALPACDTSVADNMPCATACNAETGKVCQQQATDSSWNAVLKGCVCTQPAGQSAAQWTCATIGTKYATGWGG